MLSRLGFDFEVLLSNFLELLFFEVAFENMLGLEIITGCLSFSLFDKLLAAFTWPFKAELAGGAGVLRTASERLLVVETGVPCLLKARTGFKGCLMAFTAAVVVEELSLLRKLARPLLLGTGCKHS